MKVSVEASSRFKTQLSAEVRFNFFLEVIRELKWVFGRMVTFFYFLVYSFPVRGLEKYMFLLLSPFHT